MAASRPWADSYAGKNRIPRQWAERTPPGDDQGVVHGFGKIPKELPHLPGGLETVLRRKPPPVGLAEIRAVGNADQRVVRLLHRGVGVVHVIGRQERKIELVGEVDQGRLDPAFLWQTMALELDVKASRKHVRQGPQVGLGGRTLVAGEQLVDGTGRPAGQGDQPFGAVSQFGIRDARYAAALRGEICPARQLEEIPVARLVLRQQDHRIDLGLRVPAVRLGERRNAQHRTDDRLEARPGAGHGEFERPEQVSGVGDRHGRHAVPYAEGDEVADGDGALRQRVRRMRPQVNERRVRHDPHAVLDTASSHNRPYGIRRTEYEPG